MKKKLQLVSVFVLFGTMAAFAQQKDTAEFKPSGKLWGYVFGDYAYRMKVNTVKMSDVQYGATTTNSSGSTFNTPNNYSSFDFRRIYLGYDYEISKTFSASVLTAYEGSQNVSDGSRGLYIKAANLKWKNIFHNADLVIGQSSTPTFATTSEPVWGYRSLEKTIMDMHKIGGSNDLGISLQGKFNDAGDYGYTVMIGNGSGAKVESDKYKKLYGDVWGKFLDKKIIVDLGADNEMSQHSPYQKSKTTFKAFLAYQTTAFTVGAEMFTQIQKNNTIYTNSSAVKDTTNANASGISVFAKGVITPKLSFVVRYDYFNPDTKFDSKNTYSATYPSAFTESFALAALDYAPMKNVHIMPNIWYNHYKNRDVALNGLDSKSNDVVARLTLYYIFK
jgi:hypothetical protein